MNAIRMVGLGIAIWGLSLVWPQINEMFTPLLMIGVMLGLGALAAGYLLIRRLDCHHIDHATGQDHPTHPMPVMTR
ncbi:MAG: hypothetical protein Kow0063_19240 [Anaerolineae bacterium]